ncbi:hypothetical protein BD779DRAFT_1678545 [Infundibulicybe gibba]|nr:hypothetical protein BD779DRAFT_1678545 [Infundibulicybe gibba]
MLIKLTPAFPASTVLFAMTFPEFNDGLPVPPSWLNQLNQLTMDELEHPKALHALDKAACIANILEEVSFDIPGLTITCRFYDGTTEEWPLMGARCMDVLQGILNDVNDYTLEIEREREQELAEKERERKRIESLSSPQGQQSPGTKDSVNVIPSRSLVIPLSSSSSSQPSPPSPPPTPRKQDASQSSISHRALRWRARSALVDAFRRYVLPEIKPRLPPEDGATHCPRRDARPTDHPLPGPDYFSRGTSSVPPSPFYSDEDEADTDTDGSSVHTPSSSHVNTPRRTFRASPFPERPPNLLQQYLSSNDMEEYTALSDMSDRLHQLQQLHTARQAHEHSELAHQHGVLEVRSRRRAWLNKALVGRTRDLGLATPFRSSPLARAVFSGDEYEFCAGEPVPMEHEYADFEERMSVGLRRTRLSTEARLFPVSEEDGEDDDDVRELELELGFGLDLEGGMAWREELEEEEEVMRAGPGGGGGMRVAFELERPQIRPRVRTSSMHQPNTQPLNAKDLVRAPMPFYEGGDEFTLAMDIPFSVRVQDRPRGVFAKGEDEHGWISSEDDAFDCR